MDEPLEFYVDAVRNTNVIVVGVFIPVSRSRIDWGFQTAHGEKGSTLRTIHSLTSPPSFSRQRGDSGAHLCDLNSVCQPVYVAVGL